LENGVQWLFCATAILNRRCPLWVHSATCGSVRPMSVLTNSQHYPKGHLIRAAASPAASQCSPRCLRPAKGVLRHRGRAMAIVSKAARVMAAGKPFFKCPNCEALYHIVKVEAGPQSADREITCRACGGPLPGREAKFVMKYFLLRKAGRVRKWKSA
jgi:hypothetical protein